MNLLKQELHNKRKAVMENFGGKSFLRRSELEQKEIQKRRKQLLGMATAPRNRDCAVALRDLNSPCSSSLIEKEQLRVAGVDEIHLPRHEVVRRLRVLCQPATLFGEDDAARVDRLKSVLNSSAKLHGIDDLADVESGLTNDFLRDMGEMRKRRRAGRDVAHAKGRRKGNTADDGDNANTDKDSERMTTVFDELCREDKILVFFKRLLSQWKQELDSMGEMEKRTAEGKMMIERYNECALYIEPLFDFCRKKVVPNSICQALLGIVECCMKHDYLVAMEQYIKLTIGNAAWPMGVTMVGIHERCAREKIHTNNVAHIMNDETTRRYLHSIKRLVTLCQPRYPGQP